MLIIPGMVIWIRYSLYAPVVLIEGLQGKAAMRRARELASRSWKTVIVVSLLQLAIPMTVSFFVGLMAGRGQGSRKAHSRRRFIDRSWTSKTSSLSP